MGKLISENLLGAIFEQVAHETYNSNIYFYIAGCLKKRGLDKLAEIFEKQREEELGHAKMFYDLLTDLNEEVKILGIPEVSLTIYTIGDIAQAYLDRELVTTDSIAAIKALAIDENKPIVEEFMRKMLVLQQQEIAEATTFMDKALISDNDWKFVALWNESLK